MRFILIVFMLLFTACSVKDALKNDKLYDNALKYTKRAEVVSSLETKALIDVVYLNPLYENKFELPTFLVGVYNDFDNTLNNEEFNLTINNKIPEVNTTIPKFVLYKHFPFYNEWMNYYIVEVNTSAPFVIKYQSKHWGEAVLTF